MVEILDLVLPVVQTVLLAWIAARVRAASKNGPPESGKG